MLANLLELYCHDLSPVFGLAIGADGRFGYPDLMSYCDRSDGRFASFIRLGHEIAGFVLARVGSPATSRPEDLDIAEFFVLRRHRRSQVGTQAAHALWTEVPGHWVVRVATQNLAAQKFWTAVITDYTSGEFLRREANASGRSWTVFELDSIDAPSSTPRSGFRGRG